MASVADVNARRTLASGRIVQYRIADGSTELQPEREIFAQSKCSQGRPYGLHLCVCGRWRNPLSWQLYSCTLLLINCIAAYVITLINRGRGQIPSFLIYLQVFLIMETSGDQGEKKGADVSCDDSSAAHHTPRKKRKRKHSGGEGDHMKHHGGKHGHRPPNKKFKHSFAMSSTKIANNIMKFRLGGSVSDPLNLEGDASAKLGDDCSTCAPSPVGPEVFGQPSPLPPHLQHDPLNLEGKSEDFPANKTNKHTHHGLHHHNKHGKPAHKKKQGRRRTISKTEDHEKQEVGGASAEKTTAVAKVSENQTLAGVV